MKTKLIALAGCVLLVPACQTYTSTSNGVTTIKFGAAAAWEKLNAINAKVNLTRKSLLSRFGADPAKELATIERNDAELEALRAELDKLKANSAPYKSVDENLTDAADWNATTRAGLAAQLRLEEMEARVLDDPGLTAQELDDTEALVKAFSTNVRKEWKDTAHNDERRVKELRRTTAAGPELREKARLEAEARAASKAREEARKAAQRAMQEGAEIERKVRERLRAAEVPSEAEVTALAEAVAKISEASPPEAARGERLLFDARVVRALDTEAPAPALQALFPGTLSTSGQSRGKTLSVRLSVKRNHCVVWLGRYAAFTGTERVLERKLVPSDTSGAQRFQHWAERAGESNQRAYELLGLCATRDLKATVTAKLEFTGSKNGVRYAALDFEKTAFPRELANKLSIDLPDHCDPEAWAAMWLSPVPGSLGYVNGEPAVISNPGGGPVAYFAGGPGQSSSNARVSRAPPRVVKFTHQLQWKACNLDYGDAPATRAIRACSDRIEKRYESQWRSIDRVRDVASGMSNSTVKFYSPAAEEQASRLRRKYDADFARECQPTQDKTQKAFAKRFEKLVDQLTETRPVDVLFDTAAK